MTFLPGVKHGKKWGPAPSFRRFFATRTAPSALMHRIANHEVGQSYQHPKFEPNRASNSRDIADCPFFHPPFFGISAKTPFLLASARQKPVKNRARFFFPLYQFGLVLPFILLCSVLLFLANAMDAP